MHTGFEVLLPRAATPTLRIFQPDRPNRLLDFARDPIDGSFALLMGAIYYTDDLRRRFGVEESLEGADMALRIYRERGAGALEAIEGEFGLLVYCGSSGELVVIRDPLGSWPIYWARESAGVRVSNSMRILARSVPTRVQADMVAMYLTRPFAMTELACEATMLDPIRRICPGTRTTFDREGRATSRVYWNWEERIPHTSAVTSLDEAAEAYRDLLRRAVAQRTRHGQVAAHLSGGMDSSSLTCLAHDLLSPQGRPVVALAGIYKTPSLAGERAYVEMIANQKPGLNVQYLSGDSALDYQWFSEAGLPGHDEPYPGLFRIASERLLVDGAHRAEADVVLTGAAADDMLAGDRFQIAELLASGRVVGAFRECLKWARSCNVNFWTIFNEQAWKPIAPVWLRDGLGPVLRGGRGVWPNPGQIAVPPWIERSFARRHGMWSLAKQAVREYSSLPLERSYRTHWLRTTAGDFSSWYLAAPHGLRNSHPFLDPRLAAFCLSLPTPIKEIPGRSKPVLSEAMRGILPEPIRTRRLKCHFNDVFWNGLARSLLALESMLHKSAIRDLEVLDVNELIRCMRQHALGIGHAMVGGRINTALSLVAWYDQYASGYSIQTASAKTPHDERARCCHAR